jgi:predicted RNase H-like HicB family nuclease
MRHDRGEGPIVNSTDRPTRIAEVETWIGDGIKLQVDPPRGDQHWYMALAPDIRLATLGSTEEEAIEGMFVVINRLIDDFIEHGTPLPVRQPLTTVFDAV